MKPKNIKKRRPYPEKHKEARAALIRKTRPWAHSTGPRTAAGKAAVKDNARKHGAYDADMMKLKRLLRRQAAFVRALCLSTESPKHASKTEL